MTPKINDTATRRLSIPKLSGGVNLRDGITFINDNQLTEAKNVWFKRGMLRTRLGIQNVDNADGVGISKVYADKKNFRVIDGVTYFLVCIQSELGLEFRYYPENSGVYKNVATITDVPKGDYTCNIFQHNADIYCFISGFYSGNTPYYIYKIYESGYGWEFERIAEDSNETAYIPTIATNGIVTDWEQAVGGDLVTVKLDSYEGFNLIGTAYKAVYSTVNLSHKKEVTDIDLPNSGGQTIEKALYNLMQFNNPHKEENIAEFAGRKITAVHQYQSGKYCTHSVVLDSTGNGKETAPLEDGLMMHANIEKITFYIDAKSGEMSHSYLQFSNTSAFVTEDTPVIHNNLEITFPQIPKESDVKKVMNMTFSEWYGGGAEGIHGGVHLFMGGNTDEKEKALAVWSDINKPLYFSENTYAYVGDKAQRLTAFGKQGESLIVFKEREIFSTKYVSTEVGDTTVDIAAQSVVFPFYQVHGYIGCDCPDSVQLCRNKLVWAHTDGKVYTLVSANQYNERSVYEVSGMIEADLPKKALKNCVTADWEGMYVLAVGNKIYLMDYDSYGFSAISSYSKNDDAQLHLPWWIWESHNTINDMVSIGGELIVFSILPSSLGIFAFKGDYDEIIGTNGAERKEIETIAQTKAFDFGSGTEKKSVPRVEMLLGKMNVSPINATILTESGNEEHLIEFTETEADERSLRCFSGKVIRPANQNSYRMAIRFESEGNMFLESISLPFKFIGGIE